MKTLSHWLAICFILLSIAGCTATASRNQSAEKPAPVAERSTSTIEPVAQNVSNEAPTSRAAPVATREIHNDNELLAYAKRFVELSAENQNKEYTRIMQALNRNKKDSGSRLKAALIFSLPDSRHRDNSRALSVLTDLQRDKLLDDDTRTLMGMLKSYVEERQKLEDHSAMLGQKLKEEQRRAEDLQQKLDELKNIEKTMLDRSRGTQP
jgi:hypothetical protein